MVTKGTKIHNIDDNEDNYNVVQTKSLFHPFFLFSPQKEPHYDTVPEQQEDSRPRYFSSKSNFNKDKDNQFNNRHKNNED